MAGLIKIAIFSLLLSILLYPGFEKLYLYRQTIKLEDLTMAPLSFLGENRTILSNDDKFTRYGTKYKELDLLPNRDLFIGIKNEFLFHNRWVNLTEEKNRVFEERLSMVGDYYEKIKNGSYSLIVYGPATNELDIYYLIYKLEVILPKIYGDSKNYGYFDLDNYCEIFLPSAEDKCTLCKDIVRIFIKENKTCDSLAWKTADYYSKNFHKICKLNELTANTKLKVNMLGNGFFIPDKCQNGGKLLTNYNDKAFRIDDVISVLYLATAILMLVYFRKNTKLCGYIFLTLLILFLPLNLFNESYVSEYYTNESAYAYFEMAMPPELKASEVTYSAQFDKPASIAKATLVTKKGELKFPILRYGGKFNQS